MGEKGPNTFGKDVFVHGIGEGNIVPKCSTSTDTYIKNECSKTAKGTCCLEKIRRDKWKIKSDYPW